MARVGQWQFVLAIADYYSADHLRQVATVALKSAHELAEAVLMYCRGLSTEPVIGFIG